MCRHAPQRLIKSISKLSRLMELTRSHQIGILLDAYIEKAGCVVSTRFDILFPHFTFFALWLASQDVKVLPSHECDSCPASCFLFSVRLNPGNGVEIIRCVRIAKAVHKCKPA